MVQWLGLCTSTEGDQDLIPGKGTKIPQATQHGQNLKKEKRENCESEEWSRVEQWLPCLLCHRTLKNSYVT